jgi:hypothetical protein
MNLNADTLTFNTMLKALRDFFLNENNLRSHYERGLKVPCNYPAIESSGKSEEQITSNNAYMEQFSIIQIDSIVELMNMTKTSRDPITTNTIVDCACLLGDLDTAEQVG